MAQYSGGRGIAFQGGGGNSMFGQINAAQQRMQELRQAKRTQDFHNKVNATNLGNISDDFYSSYADNQNIQLGDTKNFKEHFQDIAGGSSSSKEIRAAFGKSATNEMVQDYFKQKTAERDKSVISAISRRMDEMGTGQLHKVVPKSNEEGGKQFEEWYNNADDTTRTWLRDKGYQPGQEESWHGIDYFERRKAQGKEPVGKAGTMGLIGAGYGAYQYGKPVAKYVAGKVKPGMAEQRRVYQNYMKSQGQGLKSAQAGQNKIKSKLNRAQRLVDRLGNQKAPLSARKARQLGQARRNVRNYTGELTRWNEKIAEQQLTRRGAVKTALKTGSGLPGMGWGRGYLGMKAGGALGEAVAGEGGKVAGEIAGIMGGNWTVKKVIAGLNNPKTRAMLLKVPGVKQLAARATIATIGIAAPEGISSLLGGVGLAWTAYDIAKLVNDLDK